MNDMGGKNYDDIIKQKLASLEKKHRTPDWEGFNSMLDEMNEKDLEFDLKVSQKLSKLSDKIYVRPEWNKLYHIITERAARRNKILRTKCIEAIVVLLLLFTGYNLSNSLQHKKENKSDAHLQYAAVHQNTETIISEPIKPKPTSNTISESNNHRVIVSDNLESKQIVANQSAPVSVLKKNTIAQTKNKTQASSIINNPINPLHWEPKKDIFAAINTNEGSSLTTNTGKNTIYSAPIRVKEEFSSIKAPKINALAINNGLQNIALPIQSLATHKNTFLGKFQIAAFLTNKFNFITIPGRKNFLFDRKQKFVNTTINGGVLAEYKHKNLALSLGLEYTKIKYYLNASALEGSFLTSYEKTTLSAIKYDFISIPVDVKYYVYQDNKWRVSVLSGLGIDVLGTSEYTLEVSSNRTSQIVPPDHLNAESRLASLNYQTGVLDSDERALGFNSSNRLVDNLYTKVRLGFGAQRQINRSIGIFTDLIYQHQIDKEKGVGPNFDLIDSYAINFGLKYRLG